MEKAQEPICRVSLDWFSSFDSY